MRNARRRFRFAAAFGFRASVPGRRDVSWRTHWPIHEEQTMKRKAQAVWNGSGKDGTGKLDSDSGVLSGTQYSWKTRFADGKGTNPEELIAAAHAGCFSMALAFALNKNNFEAKEIKTDATVNFEQQGEGFAITAVHLDLTASIPGIDEATFKKIAEEAKKGCPVSRVLSATITLDAKLA
jgi:osmotically inducible protein OsmC